MRGSGRGVQKCSQEGGRKIEEGGRKRKREYRASGGGRAKMGWGGGEKKKRRGRDYKQGGEGGVADTKRPCSCINSQFITLSVAKSSAKDTYVFRLSALHLRYLPVCYIYTSDLPLTCSPLVPVDLAV